MAGGVILRKEMLINGRNEMFNYNTPFIHQGEIEKKGFGFMDKVTLEEIICPICGNNDLVDGI